jgi:CDP-paratose 2-epimerase
VDLSHVVITGGAGFVGSNLAVLLRERLPRVGVTSFDNLRRRGSELTLPRLRSAGVEFVHGDVRHVEDLDRLPDFDLLIDCSAEPSVHAGASGSPREVLNINLLGTINCLEAVRARQARLLYLSTSRVYPIAAINALPHEETSSRYRWRWDSPREGVGPEGVTESFPLDGARSFYGSSKLCSELLIREYHHTCGVPALVNRCGVIAGPWQMGKVDQGVVALWVAAHHFRTPLGYIGFGGQGKQVRDLLHVEDLFELLLRQIHSPEAWNADAYNVGGGPRSSVSLLELTDLCRAVTGRTVELGSVPETNPLDLRIYLTDARRACERFDWRPRHTPESIVQSTHRWIVEQEHLLSPLFA